MRRYHSIVWIMIVVAGIGLADASYLTWVHLQEGLVRCSYFGGCDLVTGSQYGEIGPVPTSALGIVYYGFMVAAPLPGLLGGREKLLRLLARLAKHKLKFRVLRERREQKAS